MIVFGRHFAKKCGDFWDTLYFIYVSKFDNWTKDWHTKMYRETEREKDWTHQ